VIIGIEAQEKTMDWKLEVVVVPVSDVDRAKGFYADKLGFTLDRDVRPNEDLRVVQVTPPGSACSIVFGKGLPQAAPGSMKGNQFVVTDIGEAAAHLEAAGVEFTGPVHVEDGRMTPGFDPQNQDFATFLFVDDPDGNTWSIQQGRRDVG
jgi:catechol 2,3-dioxygenase-like lactoylglutathione lyase family enzyme